MLSMDEDQQPEVPDNSPEPIQQPAKVVDFSTPQPPIKDKLIGPIVVLVVLLVVIVGGVLGVKHIKNSSKPNCTPPSGTTVTKSVAITEYGNFVKAIKASNQSCANSLSSAFFLYFAKEEFGAPQGNWITAHPGNTSSIAHDFSKVPDNLITSQINEENYKRVPVINPNGQNISFKAAHGLTLRYPAGFSRSNGKGGESPYYFYASFTPQNGKIVVDYFVEGPSSAFF